ncbi:MAG: BadF/BadG/BcrA/BcrD ATPase family protein, partial [Arachnia sp.]
MRDRVVIGLDGGGTKTACVVLDGARSELGRSRGGSTNINSVGADGARAALTDTIHAALLDAGCEHGDVDGIVFAGAGLSRPTLRSQAEAWLTENFPGRWVRAVNDAVPLLASVTGSRLRGIVLLGGTGMLVWG